MKCKIPEISWHNRDPVLSVDIQLTNSPKDTYRLASGGTDSHVLIWHLRFTEDGDVSLDLAADLTRHQRAVNAVKWSPNGELLASGDDESAVLIWKQKAGTETLNILENTNDQDKEIWIVLKVLRGHMEDVYDLCWAPNSQFLVSGSVDNSAIIWDVHKGRSAALLQEHKGFVQGVAWDPRNKHIATMSTDRFLRIYDVQTKRVVHRINKSTLPVPEDDEIHGKKIRLFHDDTLQTFFRRLCYTPDGNFLLTPAGVTDYEGAVRTLHTTYAFSRHALRQPAIVIPCPGQYAVAVRSCPLLFELRSHNVETNPPLISLPYRMIFVVATRSSVYFYDTQQRQPFAAIANIHYTRLTDATWSADGLIVIVSSTDGFCSIITFEPGELGVPYANSEAVLNAVNSSNTSASTTGKKRSKKQKENTLSKAKAQLKSPTMENDEQKSVPSTTTANIITLPSVPSIVCTAIGSEVIIDKEILSTDEKFDEGENKLSPATPISIRRHPRTPTGSAPNTPSNSLITDISQKPSLSTHSPINSPLPSKVATPIAVRRKPRALLQSNESFDASVASGIEDAINSWILPHKSPPKEKEHEFKIIATIDLDDEPMPEATTEKQPINNVKSVDTLTERPSTNPKTPSTTPKTPRRVPLKTISTPKSQKKLIE